eukprot:scaffold108748_cov36-Tisochrysis_lutea.AAC.2
MAKQVPRMKPPQPRLSCIWHMLSFLQGLLLLPPFSKIHHARWFNLQQLLDGCQARDDSSHGLCTLPPELASNGREKIDGSDANWHNVTCCKRHGPRSLRVFLRVPTLPLRQTTPVRAYHAPLLCTLYGILNAGKLLRWLRAYQEGRGLRCSIDTRTDGPVSKTTVTIGV